MNAESTLQEALRRALNAAGRTTRVFRQNSGKFRSMSGERVILGYPKGAADLSGIAGPTGRRIAIEVKSRTGRLRDDQRRWLELINSLGGVGYVAQPTGSETLNETVARCVAEIDERIAQ